MKTLLAPLLLLIFVNVYAQKADIKNVWVGNDLEYIKIDSDLVRFEVFGQYLEEKRYFLISDTLRLYDKFTTSADNYSKQHIKNFDFLINKLSDSGFILIALDSNALQLAGGKNQISFVSRKLIKQKINQFEYIKFKYKQTHCTDGCSTILLKIDKFKKLLYCGWRYEDKKGFFTAELKDSLYFTLIEILKISELDKLKSWDQWVADAPEFTIEISYDGKILYLKNYFLPSVTNELLTFLLNVSEKVTLIQSKEPIDIKFNEN